MAARKAVGGKGNTSAARESKTGFVPKPEKKVRKKREGQSGCVNEQNNTLKRLKREREQGICRVEAICYHRSHHDALSTIPQGLILLLVEPAVFVRISEANRELRLTH